LLPPPINASVQAQFEKPPTILEKFPNVLFKQPPPIKLQHPLFIQLFAPATIVLKLEKAVAIVLD
jgi:hypothetical protein